MNIAFNIWIRAMLIYSACILPFILIPIIFGLAFGLALLWGIPALLLFMAFMAYAKKMNWFHDGAGFIGTTITGMGLCFAATYGACWMMTENHQRAIDAMAEYLLFPLIAWLSAAVSLITFRKSIRSYFTQPVADQVPSVQGAT